MKNLFRILDVVYDYESPKTQFSEISKLYFARKEKNLSLGKSQSTVKMYFKKDISSKVKYHIRFFGMSYFGRY